MLTLPIFLLCLKKSWFILLAIIGPLFAMNVHKRYMVYIFLLISCARMIWESVVYLGLHGHHALSRSASSPPPPPSSCPPTLLLPPTPSCPSPTPPREFSQNFRFNNFHKTVFRFCQQFTRRYSDRLYPVNKKMRNFCTILA
jgi:hypothetical protein